MTFSSKADLNKNKSKHGEAGFSILEALVAMAVLSAALLPLLALQGQFVTSVKAMERAEARLTAQNALQAQISALNLTLTPKGQITLPGAAAVWTASPALPPRKVRDLGGGPGRFATTYYNVKAQVSYSNGTLQVIELKGIGWKPTVKFVDI